MVSTGRKTAIFPGVIWESYLKYLFGMISPLADYEKQIKEIGMSKKSELVRGFGLAMSIGAALDEIRRELGVTEEEFHVLGTPEGRPHLERMIAGLKPLVVEAPNPKIYLQPLYAGEEIIIGPTDGTRAIAQAKDVFAGYIDSDFMNYGLDVPGPTTAAMKADIREMAETDGTFMEIYGSLGRPLDQLCFRNQHQIVLFCKEHKDKLRQDGYGTFFLFKRGDEFFVAYVYVFSSGRLYVYAFRLSYVHVWCAECRHRFVLPQLEPLAA